MLSTRLFSWFAQKTTGPVAGTRCAPVPSSARSSRRDIARTSRYPRGSVDRSLTEDLPPLLDRERGSVAAGGLPPQRHVFISAGTLHLGTRRAGRASLSRVEARRPGSPQAA